MHEPGEGLSGETGEEGNIRAYEVEECIYTEKNMSPGCKNMIAVFILPDHFMVRGNLQYKKHRQSLKLNKEENIFWTSTDLRLICTAVLKLEHSENWLCSIVISNYKY